jgi:hypothetical protein
MVLTIEDLKTLIKEKVQYTQHDAQDVTNTSLGVAYKSYTALMTQVGTDAPTVTEIYNNIGPIVWTHMGFTGFLVGTLEGAFPLGKTISLDSVGIKSGGGMSFAQGFQALSDVDEFNIGMYELMSSGAGVGMEPVLRDDIMSNQLIEIRVYK